MILSKDLEERLRGVEAKLNMRDGTTELSMNISKPHKLIPFVQGFFIGSHYELSLIALGYARRMHENQRRKDGEEYIVHPLTLVRNAVNIGVEGDEIYAAILLHDVLEDCDVTFSDIKNKFGERVACLVELLTFKVETWEDKSAKKDIYYKRISEDKDAILIKLLDRQNNLSTMAGAFGDEKFLSYLEETEKYFFDLYENGKRYYPEYRQKYISLYERIKILMLSLIKIMQ